MCDEGISADAAVVSGRAVAIEMRDALCDAWLYAPTAGQHPGVLVWPDVLGLRPAFQQIGQRLAGSGYAVLVVNQFYRWAKAPFVTPGDEWSQPEVRKRIAPWRDALTPTRAIGDADVLVTWLDGQKELDPERGIGTTGYCMNGATVMRTAAARHDRIRAGASFHGVGLATDQPDSPHLQVPRMKAEFLFAIAESDDEKNPQEKDLLRDTFAAAGLPAEIEVYTATKHGWCPPDNRVHDFAQAEKAWARQLALFERAL